MRERTDLFDLLPIVYKRRDKDAGHQLRALMSVANEQYDLLQDDIASLYDDWFVGTCDESVLPHLGELVGFAALPEMHESIPAARSLIANTLDYGRRKGLVGTIEQVTTAVTGWPCHVIEFVALLARTQAISAVDMRRGRTVSLRDQEALAAVDTPFTSTARSIDVRLPDWDLSTGGYGKPATGFDVSNLGLFLWRIRAFRVVMREARLVDANGPGFHYTFDPFGRDVHLMNDPVRSTAKRIHAEHLFPIPLRRKALVNELAARARGTVSQTQYFGTAPVLSIYSRSGDHAKNGPKPYPVRIEADRIRICDLSTWTIPRSIENEARVVAVDPELGRFVMVGWSNDPHPLVDYSYGLAGDIGGGPYNRSEELAAVDRRTWSVRIGRASAPETGVPRHVFETLAEAITVWKDTGPTTVIQIGDDSEGQTQVPSDDSQFFVLEIDGAQRITRFLSSADGNSTLVSQLIEYWATLKQRGVIRFVDSGTYRLTRGKSSNTVHLKCQTDLVLEADDGCCPVLVGPIRFESGQLGSRLTLSGLWLKGQIKLDGPLTLDVRHSSIIADKSANCDVAIVGSSDKLSVLRLNIERSIVGGVRLSRPSQTVDVVDSIVHLEQGAAIERSESNTRAESGCTASVTRSTVIGAVTVNELTALDSIFHDKVTVARPDAGGMEHSFVPEDSTTPRRTRCCPTISPSGQVMFDRPAFTSMRPGHPGYMQLDLSSPETIRRGASNGSEMGVFNRLQQPQVVALLRHYLPSFVPFDIDVGVHAVT